MGLRAFDEPVKQCRTPECDRVAVAGLDRCAPCTIAYMDGQMRAAKGHNVRVGIRTAPLTPPLRRQLDVAMGKIRDGGGRLRVWDLTKDRQVRPQDLRVLVERGYLRRLEEVRKTAKRGEHRCVWILPGFVEAN